MPKTQVPTRTVQMRKSDADGTPLTPAQRSRRQLIAALTGVFTSFLMSCMALTAKLATQRGCTAMLVMFSRGLLSWLFALMLLVVRKAPREDYFGPRSAWKLILGRVAVGSTALFLFLAGVSVMPIGDATALFLTNQVWTIALSRLFFRAAAPSSRHWSQPGATWRSSHCAAAGAVCWSVKPLLAARAAPPSRLRHWCRWRLHCCSSVRPRGCAAKRARPLL